MRIRTRLWITTAVPAVFIAVVAVSLHVAQDRVLAALKAGKLANAIAGGVFERSTLRSDYLRNDNERAKGQWLSKQDQIIHLLTRASPFFDADDERKALSAISKSLEGSAAVFREIVENRDLAKRGVRDSGKAVEIENRLVGQLLLRSYDTIADARGLQEATDARIESAQEAVATVSLVFLGIVAAFVIVTAWSLGRTIVKGVSGLREGAAAIGAGNLVYRIPLGGGDEFAEVAGAFNAMASKLGSSHADLAREIAERVKAADEVERLNQDLNHTVSQLQTANQELEAFAYSVSHDLRAPLRAIDGFSRILQEDYAPGLVPEAQRFLRLVRDNTQQMGRLIDDLLAFSRLSRQPMNKQPVAPAELVRQCLEELRPEQEGRSVELTLGELPGVEADPALLKQVFFNLLANALKFTGKRESAVIEVGSRQDDGERVYFVKDNGVGFDRQYAHKLFGVFQRLHRAEDYPGTGVGLAIVQRIVHRHGGRVWAEGVQGNGATFYFTLAG